MIRCGTWAVCGVIVALATGCIRFNQTDDALMGGGDGAGGGGGGGGSPTSLAGFAYATPKAVYPRPPSGDVAIPPNAPNLSGADLEFSVSPALPGGLSLDPATGVISGTPSADSPAAPAFSSYTVTVDNGTETADATVEILITTGFVVDSAADAGDSNLADGICDTAAPGVDCTLRAAIEQAADDGGSRAILIPDGTYTLGGVITINDPALTDLAISGESQAGTIIDGGGVNQVFNVDGPDFTLANLTIRNGSDIVDGPGLAFYSSGPANALTLDAVIFDSNQTPLWGGALYVGVGTSVLIENSVFENNYSGAGGGAIDSDSNNPVVIRDTVFRSNSVDSGAIGGAIAILASDLDISGSRFENNSSGIRGGAIWGRGTIRESHFEGNSSGEGGAIAAVVGEPIIVESSTFTGNTATVSGGAIFAIFAMSSHQVSNSTFYRNEAGSHGGAIMIEASGAMEISSSTVVENDGNSDGIAPSLSGGGLYVEGWLTLRETLLAGNHLDGTANNCIDAGGNFTSDGYNLTDTAGGDCGGAIGTDLQDTIANIAYDTQLRDNGGEVLTLALLSSSVAIDADSHASCPVEDARGIARPRGAACDIGAFEY